MCVFQPVCLFSLGFTKHRARRWQEVNVSSGTLRLPRHEPGIEPAYGSEKLETLTAQPARTPASPLSSLLSPHASTDLL